MSNALAALRENLDLMPSPAPEQPGLLMRDPFQYSGRMLVVPPFLVECLPLFDGEHSELDLRELLVRKTGSLEVGDIVSGLTQALSEAGFLRDSRYQELKAEKERQFAAAPVREPAHAGSGYPDEPPELRSVLGEYLGGSNSGERNLGALCAIAAPHVSPQGGWRSYRAAYGALPPDLGDRTFVILGTSHYGAPDRFGLTRKPFRTPFGNTSSAESLAVELIRNAPNSVADEDYCHAVEHSIEFQVLFLQYLFGPSIRVLPILCGSFLQGFRDGAVPEKADSVKAFFDALGNLAAREGDRLFWVLGVDMAHIGRRYQDPFDALAGRDEMALVAERDHQRIQHLCSGDAAAFWSLVKENYDDLKWCGSAPFYTFRRLFPDLRGELIHYEQWNIDSASVVSFAGMGFHQVSASQSPE